MRRLTLLLLTFIFLPQSFCQSVIDAHTVLFNVEKELNNLIITRTESGKKTGYTDLVLKKCNSIQRKLNYIRGSLKNASSAYLTSINANAQILSDLEPQSDQVILPALTDIESDLLVKCNHQDGGLGITNYYPEKVMFKIHTIKIISSSGKTQDVIGFRVKANYWRFRNNPVSQYNFNDQITNPFLQVFLEPGEYDIWVEPITKSVTKHVMSKKVIDYKLTDNVITFVVESN